MQLTKSQRDQLILEMRDIRDEFQYDRAETTAIIAALETNQPFTRDQLLYLENYFRGCVDGLDDIPCLEHTLLALIRLELAK